MGFWFCTIQNRYHQSWLSKKGRNDWIMMWQYVHTSSQECPPSLLAQKKAERKLLILDSYHLDVLHISFDLFFFSFSYVIWLPKITEVFKLVSSAFFFKMKPTILTACLRRKESDFWDIWTPSFHFSGVCEIIPGCQHSCSQKKNQPKEI